MSGMPLDKWARGLISRQPARLPQNIIVRRQRPCDLAFVHIQVFRAPPPHGLAKAEPSPRLLLGWRL